MYPCKGHPDDVALAIQTTSGDTESTLIVEGLLDAGTALLMHSFCCLYHKRCFLFWSPCKNQQSEAAAIPIIAVGGSACSGNTCAGADGIACVVIGACRAVVVRSVSEAMLVTADP